MNTRLLPAEPAVIDDRSAVSQIVIRLLRLSLRSAGVVAYRLGLARLIIRLSPDRIRTLLYHAVETHEDSYTAGLGMNVSPHTFGKHLDYYQRHYNVASMQDIVAGRGGPCALVLTFDDGYASVGENAVPALQERGLPATVYLIGKALRGDMVWVNLVNHALNRYPKAAMAIVHSFAGMTHIAREDVIQHVQVNFTPQLIEQLVARLISGLPLASDNGEDAARLFLTPEQVQSLKSRGISFGFHTNDHYNLCLCNDTLLEQQVDASEFEDLLNSNTFAYPFGYCGNREAEQLDAKGFERVMLVRDDTPQPREKNMKRTEPVNRSPAHVFAQLEVEEPVMLWLRSVA